MRRERLIIGGGMVLATLVAVAAAAASPRQIQADYAADGRIDGSYSRADLEAALHDASVQGYGGPGAGGFEQAVQTEIQRRSGVLGEAAARGQAPAAGRVATLPFTGIDLALISAGGILLLLIGAGMRRLGGRRT